MVGFLHAHGIDAGPNQRPILTGLISGILGTIPATGLLFWLGTIGIQAEILGISPVATLAAGAATMAVAGALYAWLFGRAANNPHSGWLFGMVFGFALWAAGSAMVLPLVSGGLTPAGVPAIGLFLSFLVWGLATGVLVPYFHRPLSDALSKGATLSEVGPAAAADNWAPNPFSSDRSPT
jgi:ABC-type Co2+ transport system permease subunit